MITSRRSFVTGLTSLLVAPAIVRVESIMPVKAIKPLTIDEMLMEVYKSFDNANAFMDHVKNSFIYGQMWFKKIDGELTVIPVNEIYIK